MSTFKKSTFTIIDNNKNKKNFELKCKINEPKKYEIITDDFDYSTKLLKILKGDSKSLISLNDCLYLAKFCDKYNICFNDTLLIKNILFDSKGSKILNEIISVVGLKNTFETKIAKFKFKETSDVYCLIKPKSENEMKLIDLQTGGEVSRVYEKDEHQEDDWECLEDKQFGYCYFSGKLIAIKVEICKEYLNKKSKKRYFATIQSYEFIDDMWDDYIDGESIVKQILPANIFVKKEELYFIFGNQVDVFNEKFKLVKKYNLGENVKKLLTDSSFENVQIIDVSKTNIFVQYYDSKQSSTLVNYDIESNESTITPKINLDKKYCVCNNKLLISKENEIEINEWNKMNGIEKTKINLIDIQNGPKKILGICSNGDQFIIWKKAIYFCQIVQENNKYKIEIYDIINPWFVKHISGSDIYNCQFTKDNSSLIVRHDKNDTSISIWDIYKRMITIEETISGKFDKVTFLS